MTEEGLRVAIQMRMKKLEGDETPERFKICGNFRVVGAIYGGDRINVPNGVMGPGAHSELTGYLPKSELKVEFLSVHGENSRGLSQLKSILCVGNISGIYKGDRVYAEFYAANKERRTDPDTFDNIYRFFGREVKSIERASLVAKLDSEGNKLATFNLLS